jgi:hypothetical protein
MTADRNPIAGLSDPTRISRERELPRGNLPSLRTSSQLSALSRDTTLDHGVVKTAARQ